MSRRRLQQQGDLYAQGGWWRLRWREDVIAPDGAAKRKWSRPVIVGPAAHNPARMKAMTEKEARREAWERFLSRLDQNNRVPQSVMSTVQFIERKFFPEHIAQLKPSGRLHYEGMLKHVIRPTEVDLIYGIERQPEDKPSKLAGRRWPYLSDLRLRDVTSDDAQRIVSALLTQGRSVQTALHVRNVISAIFRHAKEKGFYIGENPAAGVRLPEMSRRDRHALTFEECRTLFAALKSPVQEMAFTMVIISANVGELLGLIWRRVNLSDEWSTCDGEALAPWHLAIRQQWYRGEYVSTKVRGRARNIPIPAALRPVLAGLKTRKRWTGPEDPIFAASSGKPLDEHNYAKRHLKPAGIKLGMPWLSWHVFRHTHATLSKIVGREVGLSDYDRMRLMGHSQLSMTDRYSHGETDRQAAALEMIAERLLGTPKKTLEDMPAQGKVS